MSANYGAVPAIPSGSVPAWLIPAWLIPRMVENGAAGATESPFVAAVVGVIAGLAPGEVTTYGEVAAEAGYPGAGRAVGNVLSAVPGLPWWRVVTATGRLVPGNEAEHAAHLRSEGVDVARGRVSPS